MHQPDHAAAHGNRANVLRDFGRLPEAFASYERALQLNPKSAETLANYALALAAAGAADRFRLKIDSSGVGPSDHTSFYLTDVPVLHLFTGQHADYHMPSDDAGKINYDGLAEVVDLVETVLRHLDGQPEVPFTKTKSSASDTPRFKVTLGVVPDYLFDGQGMRIDGTTDGKPAARAGLLRGDVVVALGPHAVTSMTGYMEALAKFEPGAETTVTVLRNGTELTLPLRF